jgi:hypothetical protein
MDLICAITSLVGRRNIGDGLLMARERLIFQIARLGPAQRENNLQGH